MSRVTVKKINDKLFKTLYIFSLVTFFHPYGIGVVVDWLVVYYNLYYNFFHPFYIKTIEILEILEWLKKTSL